MPLYNPVAFVGDIYGETIEKETTALSAAKVPTTVKLYCSIANRGEVKMPLSQLTDNDFNQFTADDNCPLALRIVRGLRGSNAVVNLELEERIVSDQAKGKAKEISFLCMTMCFIQGTQFANTAPENLITLNSFIQLATKFNDIPSTAITSYLNGTTHGFNPLALTKKEDIWTQMTKTTLSKELQSRLHEKSANSSVTVIFGNFASVLQLLTVVSANDAPRQDVKTLLVMKENMSIYDQRTSVSTLINTFGTSLRSQDGEANSRLREFFLGLAALPSTCFHPFSPMYLSDAGKYENLRDCLMWLSVAVLKANHDMAVTQIMSLHQSAKRSTDAANKQHMFQARTAPRVTPEQVMNRLLGLRNHIRAFRNQRQ